MLIHLQLSCIGHSYTEEEKLRNTVQSLGHELIK